MKTKNVLGILGFAAATAFAVPAAAQDKDSGFYAGLALGTSSMTDACAGLPAGVSCDDKDSAWRIFGGYQLNRNFAVELGYANLGESSASGFGVTASVEASAFDVVAVGILPFTNEFSAYGKLGLYVGSLEGRSNVGISADESNSGLTFGLGVRYDFTKNIGARLEWSRYASVGSDDFGETDIDLVSLGVVFKF